MTDTGEEASRYENGRVDERLCRNVRQFENLMGVEIEEGSRNSDTKALPQEKRQITHPRSGYGAKPKYSSSIISEAI